MLRPSLGAIALLLVLPAFLTPTTADGAPTLAWEKLQVATYQGEPVYATLVAPVDVAPTVLVVFAHGIGNTVEGAWLGHMEETASHGVAVVATNYRDNNGFPTLRGAEDTNAAALAALAKYPSVGTVILLGVSMGGSVSGTAIAENLVRADGVTPLYDYWIDVEGVSNVIETYSEARAVNYVEAYQGLERDAGGSPDQVPQEYVRRSPALRAHEMRIKGAILVHSVNDGTVPYNQGVEMEAALAAAGIPTEFHTLLREAPGQSEGTTGTGRIFGLAGAPDPSEASGAHLSGHAWEGDRGSLVMSTAFERLFALIAGATVTGHTATLVDGGPVLA